MAAATVGPLLESEDEIAIAGGIFYFARLFGRELSQVIDTHYAEIAPDWFSRIKMNRLQNAEPNYDDPADVRFLLAEAVGERSAVGDAIPQFDIRWRNQADALRKKLNNWFHNSLEPNIDTYLLLIGMIRELSAQSGLPLTQSIVAAEQRAKAIKSKAYEPAVHTPATTATPSPALAPEDADAAKRVVEKVKLIEKRPPIGGEWSGPHGTRKIRISRQTRDVTENGISIRNLLGKDPDAVIEAWLRYLPERQSGEALIADDGAVMAFKRGQAYLIGWLGEEPKHDGSNTTSLQGFALPYSYIFTGADVRDLVSNKFLSKSAAEPTRQLIAELNRNLAEGQVFEATEYGELFLSDESGVPKVLATVHKGIWFPGHLPG